MSTNHLDTEWTVIAPGVMALPTTKLTITYVPGVAPPYCVQWDGQAVFDGYPVTLDRAKAVAMAHMASLIEMGIEP